MPSKKQYEDSLSDMKAWMKLQANETKGELKIVSSEDGKIPFMLHVDRNEIDTFVPRINTTFGEDENKTIPRVTVAPTLHGCLMGYSPTRVLFDHWDGHAYTKKNNPDDPYRQGYVIHKIDYLHAISPTREMVDDVRHSDEHWLVNYAPKQKDYPAQAIGHIIITSVSLNAKPGKAGRDQPEQVVSGYIKHTCKEGIGFTYDKPLPPGTYMFTMSMNPKGVKDPSMMCVPVAESEYDQNKKLYAAVLSDQPGFMRW